MILKKLLAFTVAIAMIASCAVTSVAADAAEDNVASVEGIEYASLTEAIAAAGAAYAEEPVTVTLNASATDDFVLDYGVIKLETNGYSYTGEATVTGGVLITDKPIQNAVCDFTGVNTDSTLFGYTSLAPGVEMIDGAQVRIGEGTDENGKIADGSGLRFIAAVDLNDTLAALSHKRYNAEDCTYSEGYTLGIAISAEDSSEEAFIPATLWQKEGETFTVALTNLSEGNFNRKFTAEAYVEVEGVCFRAESTVTRSIYQVASGLLMKSSDADTMSKALVDVLNAYVNQTGVRLTLTDSNSEAELTARTDEKNGAYSADAFFTVGETTYKNGKYQVELNAIGKSVINTDIFNEYVRINNNNAKVSLVTGIVDNGDGSYTVTFDYADMPGGSGVINSPVTLTNGDVTAYVPEGVQFTGSADKLAIVLETISEDKSEVEAGDGEQLDSFDIHVTGVSEDNIIPVVITLPEAAEKGLNRGNLKLYHVENGAQVEMEQVDSVEQLTKHNSFTYEPLDGTIAVAMASFSEVALVADTENAWNGEYDYNWYNTTDESFTISNADQLAAFGAIVGGMAEDFERDSFTGKTVKLTSDINLGDAENENNSDLIFYPIGYYFNADSKGDGTNVADSTVYSFEGTFDGNGHTIANFYQNTWEMDGDYNDGYPAGSNHYKDAMGLFGYVVGGKVCNLTVDNFSSDGEFTPTGVIAAYAVNSTFENIAITNCNPRVYNTGNGGIVGIGGNTNDTEAEKLTFTNITIDNSNKISALWGSWDVACGGLVGMFRGAGHAYMTNCHVAAQIDVYNDVCGNYQYYWYRYAGMMIGTNKTMVTDANGYTVPETEKFHAEGCTVHFGEWNDYYYCELVENSQASYTHDYQFSRLTQVESVDETNKTITTLDGKTVAVPESGRYNYVVVGVEVTTSTPNGVKCHHFVDGEVWTHDKAGTETVDGVEVNVEDKICVYLPFNQLFTGYGWGVKHIPIYDDGTTDFAGVTILDREVADSVKKFEKVTDAQTTFTTGDTVNVGDLFAEVSGNTVAIDTDNVQVTVSPVGDTSTVTGTYTANTTDWKAGTLKFEGVGAATITITDYYFCTPTIIEVTVEEPVATEKFNLVFPNTETYLYRVGNKNTIALGSLFEEKDGVEIGAVAITVKSLSDETATDFYTYTSDATWTLGTLKFDADYTGVVEITITDNDYCTPTVLYLEVVDAKNITTATGGTDGTNYVLLKNVQITSGGYVHYWNCTVYGNGFTYILEGGADQYDSAQGHGIIVAKNAVLDNLVIVGDVYEQYTLYTKQNGVLTNCYNAAIDATNCVIQNCHISNCSTPIRSNGNTIIDTTLHGGAVANIIISGGTNTFENVTTVNYNDGRAVFGLGILISDGASVDTTKLILNGTLKQYNFISETDASSVTDDNAKSLLNSMFGDGFSDYHITYDSKKWVNTGIISMNSDINSSAIIDNANTGYFANDSAEMEISGNTLTGAVYSLPGNGNSVDNNYVANTDTHKSNLQGDYLPKFEFDLGEQSLSKDNDDDTRYMIGDINGVEAMYPQGEEPLTIDITSLMTANKYTGVDYEVNASCITEAGDTLSATDGVITIENAGNYTLTFVVNDNIFYGVDGSAIVKSVERIYEVPLTVSVWEPSVADATITISSKALTGEYDGNAISSYYYKFYPLDAITSIQDDANKDGTLEEFDYKSNISSADISSVDDNAYSGATTIVVNYTGGQVLTIILGTPSSLSSPSTANGGKTLSVNVDETYGIYVKSDGKTSAKTGTWPITSWSFKGASQKTISDSTQVTINFTEPSCVTPDTLVTLADGSQKRIDSLTGDEILKVWDFETGEYTEAPIAVLRNHGLESNTVITLEFDNGIVTKAVNEHGYYDVEARRFVAINGENAESYIGHSFVIETENGYDTVVLKKVTVEEKEIEAWSLLTAYTFNFITDSVFSISSSVCGLDYLSPFENDENLKIDAAKKQADIEKYGLFTYEEFAHLVTEEQFDALKGAERKVSVGKGCITMEELMYIIEVEVLSPSMPE